LITLIDIYPFIIISDLSNISTQILTAQQPLQSNEFKSFYEPPNDINIYNVTCKIASHDCHQNDDENYDYEFFISNDIINTRHVTCKFLPPSLIIKILNQQIYGIGFDANELKLKNTLKCHQKFNLDSNLKRSLLHILEREMRSDYDGNTSSSHGNIESNATQTVSTIDSQNYFMSHRSHDDYKDITTQYYSNQFDTI
jgi:hypothetical protein